VEIVDEWVCCVHMRQEVWACCSVIPSASGISSKLCCLSSPLPLRFALTHSSRCRSLAFYALCVSLFRDDTQTWIEAVKTFLGVLCLQPSWSDIFPLMEASKMVDLLETLQKHPNETVYSLALSILDTHFDIEEDEGEDDPAAEVAPM
jgi:Atypical Arm repeat